MRGSDDLSRRHLLAGAAALAVGLAAGCASGRNASESWSPSSAGSPILPPLELITSGAPLPVESAADITLVVDAIAAEEGLAAFAAKAARTHPGLASLAQSVRVRGEAHALFFRRALVDLKPSGTARTESVPRTEQAARAKLVFLVRRAERARLAECLTSESGALARVLVSMSASHAAAGSLMTGTPAGPRR